MLKHLYWICLDGKKFADGGIIGDGQDDAQVIASFENSFLGSMISVFALDKYFVLLPEVEKAYKIWKENIQKGCSQIVLEDEICDLMVGKVSNYVNNLGFPKHQEKV